MKKELQYKSGTHMVNDDFHGEQGEEQVMEMTTVNNAVQEVKNRLYGTQGSDRSVETVMQPVMQWMDDERVTPILEKVQEELRALFEFPSYKVDLESFIVSKLMVPGALTSYADTYESRSQALAAAVETFDRISFSKRGEWIKTIVDNCKDIIPHKGGKDGWYAYGEKERFIGQTIRTMVNNLTQSLEIPLDAVSYQSMWHRAVESDVARTFMNAYESFALQILKDMDESGDVQLQRYKDKIKIISEKNYEDSVELVALAVAHLIKDFIDEDIKNIKDYRIDNLTELHMELIDDIVQFVYLWGLDAKIETYFYDFWHIMNELRLNQLEDLMATIVYQWEQVKKG